MQNHAPTYIDMKLINKLTFLYIFYSLKRTKNIYIYNFDKTIKEIELKNLKNAKKQILSKPTCSCHLKFSSTAEGDEDK